MTANTSISLAANLEVVRVLDRVRLTINANGGSVSLDFTTEGALELSKVLAKAAGEPYEEETKKEG
jgi:hypothetical protein